MPTFFRKRKLAKNFVDKGDAGYETPLSESPQFYLGCCMPFCWIGCGLYFFINTYKYGWDTQTTTDLVLSVYVLLSMVGGIVGGFLSWLLYMGECGVTRKGFELVLSLGLTGFGIFAIWFNDTPTPAFKSSLLYTWTLASFAFTSLFSLYSLALNFAPCFERGEDKEFRLRSEEAAQKGRITSIADVDMELGGAQRGGTLQNAPSPPPAPKFSFFSRPKAPTLPPPSDAEVGDDVDVAALPPALGPSEPMPEMPRSRPRRVQQPDSTHLPPDEVPSSPQNFFWDFFFGSGDAAAPSPTSTILLPPPPPRVDGTRKKKSAKPEEPTADPDKKKKTRKKDDGGKPEPAYSIDVSPEGSYVCR